MNSRLSRVSRKFGKKAKLLGMIGVASLAVVVVTGGVVLADGCYELGTEAGNYNGGGSNVDGQFYAWHDSSHENFYVDVSFKVYSAGFSKLGCNMDTNGNGYLINGVRATLTKNGNYFRTLEDCSSRRMGAWDTSYVRRYRFHISRSELDDGWYCLSDGQFWRNHYCSAISSTHSIGGECFEVPYDWTVGGVSYINNYYNDYCRSWSCNQGTMIFYPGQTIYWNHNIWNNGPSSIKNGDISYRVDTWGGDVWGRRWWEGSGTYGSWLGEINSQDWVTRGSGVKEKHGVLSQNDVGAQYCEKIHWYPERRGSSATGTSSWACAKIPWDYTTTQWSHLSDVYDYNGADYDTDYHSIVKPGQKVTAHYQFGNDSSSHTKTLQIGYSKGIKVKKSDGGEVAWRSDSGSFRDGRFNPGDYTSSRWGGSDLSSYDKVTLPEYVNDYRLDANDQICAWMNTDYRNYAHNYGAGGWLGSARYTEDCATVPYHYPGCSSYGNCQPKWDSPDPSYDCTFEGSCEGQNPKGGAGVNAVVNSSSDMILDGQSVTFTYSFTNNGPSKTKSIGYKGYIFRMARGYTLGQAQDTSSRLYGYSRMSEVPINVRTRSVPFDPNSYKRISSSGSTFSGSIQLGNVSSGSRSQSFTRSATANLSGSMSGEVGDLVCSYIVLDGNWSVYDGRSSNTMLASNLKCVRIGKQPQMQINGSDSYASDGFVGWSPANNNRGSYAQYAQITNSGQTNNFGSAGYTWNRYNETADMIYADAWSASSNSSRWSVHSGNLSYGNVNSIVNQLKEKHGSSVEFHDGNYYIGDNIYSNTSNARTIVVHGDINIASNVTQVDAVLIATGRVYTCAGSGEPGVNGNGNLRIEGGCANRLTINGAIISGGSPVFHRTFGGGNVLGVDHSNNYSEGATAEKINYTPNLWLNANKFTGGTTVKGYTVTTQTSMPVRY